MNRLVVFVSIAAAGALVYAGSKVELALRGELGMPGFPAPAQSYASYDPVGGQLGNAVVGVLLAGLILLLPWLPRSGWWRRSVLLGNGLALAVVAVGVATFAARASGVAPVLGDPPVSAAGWWAVSVGVVWVAGWAVALRLARRHPGRSVRDISPARH
ncbi:hypothetical protein LX16_1558 [Stackebrandtia albiflava]|uniref:Uncharacterized protein n=1 Tax=Stackebrandtia albiflava TaxID=406432 RepID=A0A562VD96_9ACTN|nr:hypothetical protein [Stackebrandtia albiflava]TWJ15842.1 hypothetical protein LX16_1558 [Stackebrandtia albiflava]